MKGGRDGEQNRKDEFPQDIANVINSNGGGIKFKIERKIKEYLEIEKVAYLIRRLDTEGLPEENSAFAELLRTITRTTLHKTPSMEEAAQVIRARRFKAVALIKTLKWEELCVAKPELSRPDIATIAGVSMAELDKAMPVEEEEKKQEAAEEVKKEVSAFEEEKKVEESATAAAKESAPTVATVVVPSGEDLRCSEGHKMRMHWEGSDREHGNFHNSGNLLCNPPCGKAIVQTREQKVPYFRCAWADCDYDWCYDCGIARGGLEVPMPTQTL